MNWLLLSLAAAGLVLFWLARLALFPYGPCRCLRRGRKGQGIGSTGRAWSHCARCGGSGERIRTGARGVRRAIGKPLTEEK